MADLGSAASTALQKFQQSAIEPLNLAIRKRRRLAAFGVEALSAIPPAHLCLNPVPDACVAGCGPAIEAERRYFAGFLADPLRSPMLSRFRGVPAIVELDRYPDFASYADHVRRHSKGGVLRQVRRARERGFYCRRFYSPLYRREQFDIEISKRFRSGIVVASLLRRRPASNFPPGIGAADIAAHLGRAVGEIVEGIRLPEPPPPACPQHWIIDWGVFLSLDPAASAADGARIPRERLVGYAFLARTGDIARTIAIMGHGAFLSQHVMKLLFHDVMQWLLARADPCVTGLRYFQYGAIEHGNEGLLAWKRSFEFAPRRFVWEALPGN